MLKAVGIIFATFGFIGLILWGNHIFSIVAQMLTLAILASVDFAFIKSLLNNRIPIITRYAYLIDGDLCDKRIRYTRLVTQAWVLMFSLFIVIKLLVLFYHFQAWVLPQFLVYLQFSVFIGLAVLFFGEYALRQFLFGNTKNENSSPDTFVSFLKNVAKIPINEVFKTDFVKPEK